MDPQLVIEQTRRWIDAIVIGLNLCPFAQRVFNAGTIRYVVSDAVDAESLLANLAVELRTLDATSPTVVETTLLIHPRALTNFLDYNDFLGDGERLIARLGLRGVIQIASFHPEYQFAGTSPDDVENYTSRSPYPMLHLLREESISALHAQGNELLEIPQRNVALLRELGRAKILSRLQDIAIPTPAPIHTDRDRPS